MANLKLPILSLFLALSINDAFSAHIYWDCLNNSEIVAGMPRNAENETVLDNSNSTDFNFLDFSFNNPNRYNFSVKVRLRDGDYATSLSQRFLTSPTSNSSFGIAWDYSDPGNYSAAMFQRVSENNFDEITRSDYFKITILNVIDGKQTVVKVIKSGNAMALDPREFNSIQVMAKNGLLSVSAGHTSLTPIFTTEYNIPSRISASIIAGSGSRVAIKRIEFIDYPDNTRSYMSGYTQSTIDRIIKNSGEDIYVGFWRYLDRNTDDKLFELGGKYTIAIIPDGKSGYKILYVSGASRFQSYWSPFMEKGMLSSTPFYNNYDLHWLTADKSEYSDECHVSVSENIMTFFFPIQKSTIRFYKIIPSEENP